MEQPPASVVVRARAGRSEIIRGRASGPLRLLFPRASGDAAWVVTSSLGGGLVDGDRVALEVEVEAGATAVVTTQASSKAYRGASSQTTLVRVADGATALVLPDPLAPFRGARLVQRTRVELASSASLALADVITAGRVAFGERWDAAVVDSGLAITVAGRAAIADRLLLDPAHGSVAARMRRFDAVATVVLVGPRFAREAEAALASLGGAPRAGDRVVVAGSAVEGGAAFRVLAATVALANGAVRALLGPACAACGEAPWERKW